MGELTLNNDLAVFSQHEHLVRTLRQRRLLVVVGPLVREAAGLLGLRGLVERGLEAAEFSEEARRHVHSLADRGQYTTAFERIKAQLGPRFASVYQPLLAGERPIQPASLRALARLAGHLPQVLTTNLDNLIEFAMPGRWAPLTGATVDLASRTQVVVKMMGDARHVTSWRFTRDCLQHASSRVPHHFGEEVVELLKGQPLLFIGYRGDDELFAELLRIRKDAPRDQTTSRWVGLIPPDGLETRGTDGPRCLHRIVLDVPDDDPVAYDGAVARYLTALAHSVLATATDPMAEKSHGRSLRPPHPLRHPQRSDGSDDNAASQVATRVPETSPGDGLTASMDAKRLDRWLAEHFAVDEMRRLAWHGPSGDEIFDCLPENCSRSELSFKLVLAWRAHGVSPLDLYNHISSARMNMCSQLRSILGIEVAGRV